MVDLPGEEICGLGADTGVVGLFSHADLLGPPSFLALDTEMEFRADADDEGGASSK